MKSRILSVLTSLLFIIPTSASAQEQKFVTDLVSEYTFTASGSSTIKQNFSVTNLTSEYLTSNYEILFPGQLPNDLSGYDTKGKLTFQTEKVGVGTRVRVIFNSLAAGKDEVLNFTLSFAGPKASRHDNIWEITIPSLANTNDINNYSLQLNVPTEMGLLAYSSLPAGKPQIHPTGGVTYIFSDSLTQTNGLSAVFGQFQTWGFRLNYQLINQTRRQSTHFILLPSDNIGQKISFNSFKPDPENIEVTSTGSWIGKYVLLPEQELNVEVIGQIRLSAPPSPTSSMPNASIISFSAPGITPPTEYFRPVKSEIFYDIYSASFPKISLDFEISKQLFPSLDNSASLRITNSGNTAAYWVPINIQSSNISTNPDTLTIPVIPPFSTNHQELTVHLGLKDLFLPKHITVSAGNTYINYNVPTHKLAVSYVLIIVAITLCILTLAGITHQTGSVYIQRRQRQSNLHRKSQKS